MPEGTEFPQAAGSGGIAVSDWDSRGLIGRQLTLNIPGGHVLRA